MNVKDPSHEGSEGTEEHLLKTKGKVICSILAKKLIQTVSNRLVESRSVSDEFGYSAEET